MELNFRNFKLYVLMMLLFPTSLAAQNSPGHDAVLSVERIWDRAAHNAFTSMIQFNGKLYCAFREGNGHVSDSNGSIRVIASEDGQNWESVAFLSELGIDLRDPQLSITPDNRIMLNIGGSKYTGGKLESMHPKVSFSDNTGKAFSPPRNVALDGRIKSEKDWLWRATWHKGKVYAGVYQPTKEKSVQLVVSEDGIKYTFITSFDVSHGNETTLRFRPNDEMVALVRRGKNNPGSLGFSSPPYTTWTWKALDKKLGGPDVLLLDDGSILCASRKYGDKEAKTILMKVALDGTTNTILTLPSAGDCSYPGLVLKDNMLLVSYYSSHEEKTAIYLARIAYVPTIFDMEEGQ
ncbi:MAG: sialidase family protein [Bacteroidota bacterium]